MNRKYLVLCFAALLFAGRSLAQTHCATDEVHRSNIQQHPDIALTEKQLNDDIRKTLSRMDFTKLSRTTTATSDTAYIDIPVVMHIMHSYSTSDYIIDNDIYNLVARMNRTYSLQYDTSVIIAPFKKYVGKAFIRFHLATRDPEGNPTTGVTRRFTYLAYKGDDQAKMDEWSPVNYYNIWFESVIGKAVSGGTVLAYAAFPSDEANYPFYDGVICAAPFINDGSTIEHETGHYFSLYHPWNSNGTGCGLLPCGDDEVDDTPPTVGHPSCPGVNLYDSTCANSYFKVYLDVAGLDSLADYPDTTNVQNIMDYACELMFSKGQVARMRACLANSIGSRDSLHTPFNLAITGAFAARPDLTPLPDFYPTVNNAMAYFTCPGTNVKFANRTWRDTVTALNWTFSNGATNPTYSMTNPTYSNSVTNAFATGGWVNISMTATGNHSGDNTVTWPHTVYVADATATPAGNFVEEFSPTGDLDKWPMFNYYNNEFQWQASNVGYFDHNSIMYTGYDNRVYPSLGIYPPTGTPWTDFDDFFSIPVDLSAFSSGTCNLDFFTAGASRTSNGLDINDTFEVAYSTNKGMSWTTLVQYGRNDVANNGAVSGPFVPTSIAQWDAKTLSIPTAARGSYVVFRFRYRPGVDHDPGSAAGYYWPKTSTGNNFYIDRISFSRYPASVANVQLGDLDVAVAPNPTNGNAFVVIRDVDNAIANIVVSDISGRVVYTASQQLSGKEAHIEIPQSALTAKGIYMVQTTTGSQSRTQKLVVY